MLGIYERMYKILISKKGFNNIKNMYELHCGGEFTVTFDGLVCCGVKLDMDPSRLGRW